MARHQITPEEELGYLQQMQSELKKATPGSPDWNTMVTYCLETCMASLIARVKSDVEQKADGNG